MLRTWHAVEKGAGVSQLEGLVDDGNRDERGWTQLYVYSSA